MWFKSGTVLTPTVPCYRKGQRTQTYSEDTLYRIGPYSKEPLSGDSLQMVSPLCPFTPHTILKFFRLEKKGQLIYSREYTRPSAKRNNFTIMFSEQGVNKYGLVDYFIEVRGLSPNEFKVLAFVSPVITTDVTSQGVCIKHLEKSLHLNEPIPISVDTIFKCVSLQVCDSFYVVNPLHTVCMSLSC